ncbi:hypothetical protein B0H10DRAFT_1941566 [Mycena sp. CBHHK59/15]|nr:hypothetical protein B0H10DRAFT_1941566 [Mycena sp. CBHHK59/15]
MVVGIDRRGEGVCFRRRFIGEDSLVVDGVIVQVMWFGGSWRIEGRREQSTEGSFNRFNLAHSELVGDPEQIYTKAIIALANASQEIIEYANGPGQGRPSDVAQMKQDDSPNSRLLRISFVWTAISDACPDAPPEGLKAGIHIALLMVASGVTIPDGPDPCPSETRAADLRTSPPLPSRLESRKAPEPVV